VLLDVGVLFVVMDVGTWFCNALMFLVLCTVEVLVTCHQSHRVGFLMLSFIL
jgi:hypothetical protein